LIGKALNLAFLFVMTLKAKRRRNYHARTCQTEGENMKRATSLIVIGILSAFLWSAARPVKSAEMDDRQAMDILQNMARTLAEAKQLSFTLRSSYDALQENGQMIEFGAVRKIQVKRPGNLRVDLEQSDGNRRMLVFDGKQILVYSGAENVYARAEKVGSVDDAVNYLVGALKIQIPLARMFETNFPAELQQLVEKIDYVELDMLTDVPTDHLAVRTRDVDFQIWIAQGKEPLPRRIVIIYKNAEGEPQFRADFSNWNLAAKGVKGPFTFTPPENAEQIPFIVRSRSKAGIPAREGGSK
jgi:hypothetical protein